MILAVGAIAYFIGIWLLRDWLFVHVLGKHFEQRDPLLLMWFAIGLAMLLRDQLTYFLSVREQLKAMSTLTFISAFVSIAISYFGIRMSGVIGALGGILVGEILNVGGLIYLSFHESSQSQANIT